MATLSITPSEKTNTRSILASIFKTDVKTWNASTRKYVLTHKRYGGKVRLYDGYIVITSKDPDMESQTLGAFVNLLHRRAKNDIKAVTIVF